MQQLNYHHLYYFYVVAREGSIVKAADILHLTPQTISGQISAFEKYLDKKLFDRKGKRLLLNESGHMVYGYADDIFSLGGELQQALNSPQIGKQIVFKVGVTDVIPKVLAFNLLEGSMDGEVSVKLVIVEGDQDSLLAELALSKLDLIIGDRGLMPGTKVKAYAHQIGESGLTFFASTELAGRLTGSFPASLNGQPFIISGEKSIQKLSLLAWFDQTKIHPRIVAEFDDSALMKYFGKSGSGIFCMPSVIEEHIVEQYGVSVIGRTNDVTERFFAISPERKIEHPGVINVLDKAKTLLGSANA